MANDEIIERITKAIRQTDARADIYLFGSRARGDNRPDSDWDILILIDDSQVTGKIEDSFRNELYDIELETGQIITTFIYPKNYWSSTLVYSPLYNNVKKEGVRL